MKKLIGFTLAEVLITLVIIGIIAALTIPNLLQKYQEQATVKKVQKFYSNLSNAYNLAMKDNGTANEWGIIAYSSQAATTIYEKLFKPYFKIGKDCGLLNTGNCIADVTYKFLNNQNLTTTYATDAHYYKITLADGSNVWFNSAAEDNNMKPGIFYDTNGVKEPNQWGKDLFAFRIKNDKMLPLGLQSGEYSVYPFNSYCKQNSTQATGAGFGCAAWVIYKGNMDYLHCDLTWDKNSCKDK